MIKDLLVAIALGAVLGFGVTGGFFIVNNSHKSNSTQTPPPPIVSISPAASENLATTIPDESITPPQNENLNIDSPQNESIVSTSKITIKGTSKPNNIVVIKTPVKTYNLTIDKTGTFSVDVDLETGINIIQISSIDTDDNQTDLQLIVTYSTSKF